MGKPPKMTLDQFYRYCNKCPYLHQASFCSKLQKLEGYCFYKAENRGNHE